MNGRDAVAPYAAQLRDTLIGAEHDLENVSAYRLQMISLYRRINTLQKGLDDVVQRCRSRLAPVHMLPPELLVLVFRYCAADQATPLHYLYGSGALTHVCRRWRIVALDAPELWTHIDASDYLRKHAFDDFSKGAPRILLACLNRSRVLPLRVKCVDQDFSRGFYAEAVFHRILTQRRRVRDLYIVSSGSTSYLRDAKKIGMTGFPMLHHLDLSDFSVEDTRHVDAVILPAPALRSIVLPPDVASLSPKFFEILPQITTYSGPALILRTNILNFMSNLEDCTISEPYHRARSSAVSMSATFSADDPFHNLRILRLHSLDEQILILFQQMHAPRLESLVISPPFDCDETLQLIGSMGRKTILTSLSFTVNDPCTRDALTALRACPNLDTLEVHYYRMPSAWCQDSVHIFNHLASVVVEEDDLLTKLRILRIFSGSTEGLVEDSDVQRLVQQLASRRSSLLENVEFGSQRETYPTCAILRIRRIGLRCESLRRKST
ncbi:hypothetical protein K523DRAFT_111809 [Schizophyllum commune Tattone D]|nr:hypothetical protein K523DRAFT_111809 [Schizophyllum commune Tattone D]